jgi:uncharacterized linocin/CFP29 family protein
VNLLRRSLAPVPDAAWEKLEEDARDALKEHLTARRVVDFDGPHGLDVAALNLGSLEPVELGPGASGGLRQVQPLFEVRVPFVLSRRALDDAARGAPDFDTGTAVEAARRLAEIEDRAVFHGLEAAEMEGICDATPHPALSLGEAPVGFADAVTRGLMALDDAGVSGPFTLLLGSSHYRRLAAVSEPYPPLRHLTNLISGPVLRTRGLDGGLLVSRRGGDFRLSVGQDIAIGYLRDDGDRIELFFVESFTFLVLNPEAAIKFTP